MIPRFTFPALIILACVGVSPIVSYQLYQRVQERAQERGRERFLLERRKAAWEELKRTLWQEIRRFDGTSSVVVEDLQAGWTLVHEPEKPLPAASLIKVPLMEAVFQAAQEGKIRLEDEIILKGSDQVLGSGVLKSIPPGSRFKVSQLIELMIAKSDNTAANILIRLLGFDEANRYFQNSGLKKTKLVRTMMDFSKRRRGVENTTTAQDMALSLKRIYRHELISPEVSEICLGFLKRQAINDRIPARLPAGMVVAHKTGLERGVCHDAGILFTKNGDLLICVLTKNKSKRGSKPAKRFIAALAAHAYDYTNSLYNMGPS